MKVFIVLYIVILGLASSVLGDCLLSPGDGLIHASGNEPGTCDWYNGKKSCSSCSGLTSAQISLAQYELLFNNTMRTTCGQPPADCKDYIMSFMCGLHCSQYIVQSVDLESSGSSETSSASSSSIAQTTVCQYFADRTWEKCYSWKIYDKETRSCRSLRDMFGNAQGYFGSIAGGVTVWAPQQPVDNVITNCFNTATANSPVTFLLMLLIFASMFI